MKFVCISDTHNTEPELPEGDVLIHAGDLTRRGSISEVADAAKWLESLDFAIKIVIAGNHDFLFETEPELARKLLKIHAPSVDYLQDSFYQINGLKIYGSPWQPRFFNWAFNLTRGEEISKKWKRIPMDTDILITHGPPSQILDYANFSGRHVGCEDLRFAIRELQIKYHIFGHIHEGAGQQVVDDTTYINASVLDERYAPIKGDIITFEI